MGVRLGKGISVKSETFFYDLRQNNSGTFCYFLHFPQDSKIMPANERTTPRPAATPAKNSFDFFNNGMANIANNDPIIVISKTCFLGMMTK